MASTTKDQMFELLVPFTDENRDFPKGLRVRFTGDCDGPLLVMKVGSYRIAVRRDFVRGINLN